MSQRHIHSSRWFNPVLLGLLSCAFVGASASAGDILDDFKKKEQLEAQKLDKEVQSAMLQVRQIEGKEPAKALGILRTYKHILENDTHLSKKRRDQLLYSVSQKIKVLETAVSQQKKTQPTIPDKKSKVDELYSKYEKYSSGKPAPKTSYNTANKYFNQFKHNLAASKGFNNKKQQAALQVLNNIDLGDIPENGFVSYSKDWKAKTALRRKLAGMQLTPAEAKLLKIMNSVLSVSFDRQPIQDVLDYLEKRTGATIVVSPVTLREVGVEYETPVSMKASKATVRTVLKKVLGEVGLAYILKDGIIQVVTPQVAQETMTVRSVYIADLLPTPDPRFGPFFNQARAQYFANQIMQMIVMTVEPQSWAVNGGRGTIWYNPATQSIVIRNSAEMHLSLKGSFGR